MNSLNPPSHTFDALLPSASDEISDHDDDQWLGYEGLHPMTWLPEQRGDTTAAARQ